MLRINVKHLFIVVFLGLMASSCDDDSLSHEEHTDADGLVLELNGQEVYREFEGDIVINNLTLNVGDTLELSVHFLDHDGDEIEHEEEEEEHDEDGDGLVFSGHDTSIVIIEVEEHEEGFHVIGVLAGSTNFRIELMHEGHADYISQPINVIVGSTMRAQPCTIKSCNCCPTKLFTAKTIRSCSCCASQLYASK